MICLYIHKTTHHHRDESMKLFNHYCSYFILGFIYDVIQRLKSAVPGCQDLLDFEDKVDGRASLQISLETIICCLNADDLVVVL